jgi:hypothetical protein
MILNRVWECGGLIDLIQETAQWRVLVNTIMKTWFL